MSEFISRRTALRDLGLAVGSLALMRIAAAGAAKGAAAAKGADAGKMPHLAEDEPMAEAITYRENAAKIRPGQIPEFKAGQNCANCASLTGAPGAHWRPCTVIPGYLVSADGWCQMYVKRA